MIVNPGIEIILTISTKMPHEPYIETKILKILRH